ncbi:carboxymuconolactone decarboxylase family protein [Martelella sp. HB161492]|uniref:carboxymuconolactone decarboxylase family protein n=1 Tax=Martelella sp. HB161492 TaxID=2720726 RepID=UPI001590BCE5|nr:carboxymuconolactone decarboxylase family protein [Martelella sp. HB161492]
MRFEIETYDAQEGAAKALADRALGVSADGIGGPFNMLLKSPATGAKVMDLLDHFNGGGSHLDSRTRRLAVLILARKSGARYAWWTHRRRALAAGEFSPAQIAAINGKRLPEGLDERLVRVHAYVSALAAGTPTPEPVLKALKAVMSEAEIVDLIAFCGLYSMIAMILNEADVGLPEGEDDTLTRD